MSINFSQNLNIAENDKGYPFITGIIARNDFLRVALGFSFGIEDAQFCVQITFTAWLWEMFIGDSVEFWNLLSHFKPQKLKARASVRELLVEPESNKCETN